MLPISLNYLIMFISWTRSNFSLTEIIIKPLSKCGIDQGQFCTSSSPHIYKMMCVPQFVQPQLTFWLQTLSKYVLLGERAWYMKIWMKIDDFPLASSPASHFQFQAIKISTHPKPVEKHNEPQHVEDSNHLLPAAFPPSLSLWLSTAQSLRLKIRMLVLAGSLSQSCSGCRVDRSCLKWSGVSS